MCPYFLQHLRLVNRSLPRLGDFYVTSFGVLHDIHDLQGLRNIREEFLSDGCDDRIRREFLSQVALPWHSSV